MNTSSRYLQYIAAVFIYVNLVNGLAPRRASSNVNPKTRPLKIAENVTETLNGDCPEPDGYFPDPYQCDKYFECREGKIIAEKLCPDGMVFNDFSPQHEKCDLPFNIDCSQRTKYQEPKPTLHCPRLNGYFNHEDPNACNKFYYCVDGKFNLITCPDGLVYNEKTGICSWPDEAKKKGCSSQDLFKFSCPKVDLNIANQHPRYPDPEDCQYFYVCINGEVPRRSGCRMGQVFNDETGACDWPKNVPDCAEWYKGILTDEELEALEHPTPKPKPKLSPHQSVKRQKNRPTANQDFARNLDTTQLPQ